MALIPPTQTLQRYRVFSEKDGGFDDDDGVVWPVVYSISSVPIFEGLL